MKDAVCVQWTEKESEPGWGISRRKGGYSLHLTLSAAEAYMKSVEETNKQQSGEGCWCIDIAHSFYPVKVEDSLYKEIEKCHPDGLKIMKATVVIDDKLIKTFKRTDNPPVQKVEKKREMTKIEFWKKILMDRFTSPFIPSDEEMEEAELLAISSWSTGRGGNHIDAIKRSGVRELIKEKINRAEDESFDLEFLEEDGRLWFPTITDFFWEESGVEKYRKDDF